MNSIILYLIQVAIIFSALYLLYIVLLEKLTFHKANRLVLLLLLPISVIIPFVKKIVPSLTSKMIEVPLFKHFDFETIDNKLQAIEQPLAASSFNYSSILIAIYIVVFSIFFIRILGTARQLVILKSKSKIIHKEGCQLVIANVPEIFSYFNWIFIPENKFEHYGREIIEHEKTHIKLKHSYDVILTELYIAFFWFNPLLYFYRKSLKSVHEFQADSGVLKNGIKISQYMELLKQNLEVSNPNNLYNYFNQPILKKRVLMMTKPTSNSFAKLKYMLLLPVCTFLISAFITPIIKNNKHLDILTISEIILTPPSLFPIQNGTRNNITSHFGIKSKHPKTKKNVTHTGIDIRAKIGTPVFATADGIIAKASLEGNWGNLIVITHSDGYQTRYTHLNGFNIRKNQEVKKGDIIGYTGNTGLSRGPHLHYEVKQNGKHLNPLDYLE